jgi:hypothetical protein
MQEHKINITDEKIPQVYNGIFKVVINEIGTFFMNGVNLKLSYKFYKILRNKPKYIKYEDSNTYVFGHLFTTEESIDNKYYIAGTHYNDSGQTGIVYTTKISDDEIETIGDSDLWEEIYDGFNIPYDDYSLLSLVQKKISPRIFFVGETVGGDVGATVLVHFNKNNEIDSLIIDNCVFLKNDIE